MRRDVRVLCAIAVALVPACSTGATEPGVPRTLPAWMRTCQLPDGAAALCGDVDVAEAPQRPQSRRIALRVVVLPARSPAPAPDPVVLLAGGPGQGAADLAVPLSQRGEVFRNERDLVLIDQRGTGKSNGLHCPAPATAPELMGTMFDAASLTACRDELAKRADLTRYDTSAAAADYPIVLDALGYERVNVWGASYGTRLGLELARRYPDRIRTLMLEGVAPHDFQWPTSGAPDADRALAALADDCAADDVCAREFPAFRQDVATAFARVRRRSVEVDVRDPASGATSRVLFGVTDLAYATRGLLYGREALLLPRFFRAAAAGDFGTLAQAYVTRARVLDRQIADGVHLGVYCAEDVPFVDWRHAREAAAATRIGTYLLDEYRRACDVWRIPAAPAAFRESVRVAVPTLLMAGRRDPVTPPRTAEDVARTLPRSRVVVWKYGGHGTQGLPTTTCHGEIARQFVTTADPAGLDLSCMGTASPERFRGR